MIKIMVLCILLTMGEFCKVQLLTDEESGRSNITVNHGIKQAVYRLNVTIQAQHIELGRISWVRIRFRKDTHLRKSNTKGWGADLGGDVIKITSQQDMAVQYLNNETVNQWGYRSAIFNGHQVQVELFSNDTSIPRPSLRIQQVEMCGVINVAYRLGSLCEKRDERESADDNRTGRIFPAGCSAWTVHGGYGCQLTAGHCIAEPNKHQIFQLNVPHSIVWQRNGEIYRFIRHPDPQFQWAIDPASVQQSSENVGYDHGFFGTFRNPNTGLTPFEVSNGGYRLSKLTNKRGQKLTILGYGEVFELRKQHLSRTLLKSQGKLYRKLGCENFLYRVSTTTGNSGSVVLLGNTTLAVGIHVGGGCAAGFSSSYNLGVLTSHPGLQWMLRNPKGVCRNKNS